MKLLKKYFLTKIDKVQIKQINDRHSIRLSTLSTGKNYEHYFFYLDSAIFLKIQNIFDKIDSIKVYVSSPDEIRESKGELFRYNVAELYLRGGKIITL